MTLPHPYIENMAPPLMTADELLRLYVPGKRTELINGVLMVREPASYKHGRTAMALSLIIGTFVREHRLGDLLAAETGFKLTSEPDTVRAPDVAFVSTERIPLHQRGFPAMAPDLAVEVLSPDDRPGEVLGKVADWLRAGSKLVWVIDPERRSARVYREDGRESLLNESDSLDGESVLPGFTCPLAEILTLE
jgi:Uma2 family endonuclease